MVDEKDYEMAFQIITVAGTARSLAMEARKYAREAKFEQAKQALKQAKDEYIKSHQIQTDMLTKEASGEKNDVNIILVHAQDHLTMASMSIEDTKEFINLYELIRRN
ncbi:MAG: PTS lactose/cellobiose transporter subunit IIA [Tissierellia bacterium]|nr:PTS lactose/cellobiose transporter subunit IIA [Tissierellia bacterium]